MAFAADAVFSAQRAQLIKLAARTSCRRCISGCRWARASYGEYDTDAYRLAGSYAGRILKGEKPADLSVQQSTKVELVVDLKTAKALGVAVPLTRLGRAAAVIH